MAAVKEVRIQKSRTPAFFTPSFLLPRRGGENLHNTESILCLRFTNGLSDFYGIHACLNSVKFPGILAQNLLNQPGGHVFAGFHGCHELSLLRGIVVAIVGAG